MSSEIARIEEHLIDIKEILGDMSSTLKVINVSLSTIDTSSSFDPLHLMKIEDFLEQISSNTGK
jgi:hypothetical protein